VAVVELVAAGKLPTTGFIQQEDIPFQALLETKNGARFAELGQV
jgi:saccharopine dehydrogenase (NAD+, L-lysine-forming)